MNRRRSPSAEPAAPWYAEGLRFECLPSCGACCTNHGEYSFVYLEGDDEARLAEHLRLSRDEFRTRYAALDEEHVVLRMDQPACPFLDGSACTVYEARPRQCRTFPFWPESLRSRSAWRGLARFCPGIDRGPRHDLLSIRDRLATHDDDA